MKIVFFDLGKHFGGAENYLFTIIENAIQRGNESVIIVRQKSLFARKCKEKKLECELIEVKFDLESVKKVKRYLKEHSVDVINVNGINSGIFKRLLNINIPTVTTVHSNAYIDRIEKSALVRKLFILLENHCLKHSDNIITVSNAIKDLLVNRGINSNKIVVVNNGIQPITYKKKQFDNGKLKMCFIGRLEKVKGADILIDALGNLSNGDWECDIYGDGSEINNLKNRAKKLGIFPKIEFMGFEDDVRKRLHSYDVLIQPSRYEAFSLSIIEAMNARTLVVCSDVGGMGAIVEDSVTGYKFPVGNINTLTDILNQLLYNKEVFLRITDNAYKLFLDNYTQDKMANKTLEILRKVSLKNV